MATQDDKPGKHLKKSARCQIRYIKVHQTRNIYTKRDPVHSHFDEIIETPVPWIQLRGKKACRDTHPYPFK